MTWWAFAGKVKSQFPQRFPQARKRREGPLERFGKSAKIKN
jgi:hypothetical protein